MPSVEDLLPDGLTDTQRADAIADAREFLKYAANMRRPNLSTYLGRGKWHSIITAEITHEGWFYSIRSLKGIK